ncbi:MAG TPA: prephenate dehydratase [Bacteroidota bacterium]|nr:prephenate dehydratase [Bacteroidota bacterium]
MNVAFQGIHGAYSEAAARSNLGKDVTTVPCETFAEVFDRVERRRSDRGVIPIENSLAGSIHENYDLLLAHGLHIVGEQHERIEHALMCPPRGTLGGLTTVRSHPQALAQCSRFLLAHPSIKAVPFFDTAGAAEAVAREGHAAAGAIAGTHAARLYGLRILKRNIENSPNNYTRFLVLARAPWKSAHGTKTRSSIVFTPAANRPGILFHILGVFALRDIDLLKIESRPDPRSPFEYRFYADIAGGPHEDRVARAFDHLKEIVSQFRLLGTYPAADAPAVRRRA